MDEYFDKTIKRIQQARALAQGTMGAENMTPEQRVHKLMVVCKALDIEVSNLEKVLEYLIRTAKNQDIMLKAAAMLKKLHTLKNTLSKVRLEMNYGYLDGPWES